MQTKKTIIVVEDKNHVLFLTLELLKVSFRTATCVGRASGSQLFSFLADNPNLIVDVILLDINIPHEDGYSVLQKIRLEPRLDGVKVIAFTAGVMPDQIQQAKNAGFDGCIGKPINAVRFPDQVQRIMNNEFVWEPI